MELMMNNDIWGAFIAGIAFCLIMFGIFQIGINIGLNTCVKMLDGNYPAAMNFLNRNKQVVNILPYVIGSEK